MGSRFSRGSSAEAGAENRLAINTSLCRAERLGCVNTTADWEGDLGFLLKVNEHGAKKECLRGKRERGIEREREREGTKCKPSNSEVSWLMIRVLSRCVRARQKS